ncbi:hypothetical protein [uncultured Aquimarina sp.]|uniref:hypothetical protein n=1 Tax=uncultured Aquimarina sp. TaxID=575652 RepID=UPI00261ACCB5|nr:hypothetical protein [uncultured Aquimarina sp.]
MNYIQEFRNILLSQNEIAKKQIELDHLARNSYPTGIHPNSQKTFALLKKKVAEKIKELEAKLPNAKGADKKDLQARIKELKDAQKEFKVIEQSDTMYSFRLRREPEFLYFGKSDEGTIYYDGTLRVLINELKHAFQFESGQMEFLEIENKPVPGLTYDVFDELATYKRQYAFDGVLKMRISLSEQEIFAGVNRVLTGDKNFGTIEIKRMKDIKVAVIAKVSDSFALDGLYQRISQKELDIHSSTKEVFNANKENRFERILNISLGSADKKKPYLEYIKVFIQKKPIIYAKY